MADIQAEEDDDEGFGDFKFAPASANLTARHSSAQNDDYWGGFVGFDGPGLAQSKSYPSLAPNSGTPFGLFMDQSATEPPVPSRAEPEKPKWVKPSGAIPLSIFGEDEVEEPSANGEIGSFQHTNGDLVKKASNSKTGVGLDDLIGTLLNQNQQIVSINVSNGNLASTGESIYKHDSQIRSGTEANVLTEPGPIAVKGNEELDDEEDEWEFMAADEKAKEEQNKAAVGLDLNFNIPNPSSNGLSSDLPGFASNLNELKPGVNGIHLDSIGKQQDFRVDDFTWGFKGSGAESHPKDRNFEVNGKRDDLFVEEAAPIAVGNVVRDQTDVYVASNEIAQTFGAFDFAFDLNPTAGSQDSIISDSNPTSNTNAVKYDLNINPTNGCFTSDEIAWEFKDAVSEIRPSSQDGLQIIDKGFESSPISRNDAKNELQHEEDPKETNEILSNPANGMASADDWGFQDAFSDSDLKEKMKNEEHQANEQQSFPLPIVGYPKLEKDDSLMVKDVPSAKSAHGAMGGIKKTSSMSISDLLSLYAQAAKDVAAADMKRSSETDLHLSKTTPNEESANFVDDSDDSWNFKGASPEKRDEHQSPAEQQAENGSLTLPETRIVDGEDTFDDDSWDFKGASPENRDEIQSYAKPPGENMWGLNLILPESEIKTSDDTLDDDSWNFKTASPLENGNLSNQLSANVLGLGLTLSESRLLNSEHIRNDSSWEFKDANSAFDSEDLSSIPSFMESHQKLSTKIENDDLIAFYSKLKDDLCVISACHLDKMKKACGLTDLQREDAKMKSRNEEIQELCSKLQPPEVLSDGHSEKAPGLNEVLKILQEKFPNLEAEYQLSSRLRVAEEDPESLIELLRHVAFMLKILRLGSLEERSRYLSAWAKLISACGQELKHGALVWKQALEQNVQSQLLSTSEGKKYVLSLGEIYRAVGVLEASTKLYKPWTLVCCTDFSVISASLHEYSISWLNSGLKQALQSISDPVEFQYEGTIEALLESIHCIHNLDIHTLQNHNFADEGPVCRLSLLSTRTIPDMKMVEWKGEPYFLKLANSWANLVSCNAPDLPRMNFG